MAQEVGDKRYQEIPAIPDDLRTGDQTGGNIQGPNTTTQMPTIKIMAGDKSRMNTGVCRKRNARKFTNHKIIDRETAYISLKHQRPGYKKGRRKGTARLSAVGD